MNCFVRVSILIALGALAACASEPEGYSKSPRDAAAYNVQLGIAYLKQGDVSSAQEKIERALKQDPQNPAVHTAAALLYDRMGETSRADRHYAIVVRMKPKDAEALNNYAIFLCRNKRSTEGYEMFQKAAASPLNRAPEVAYTNAGICLRRDGKLDESQRAFEQALALQPNNREANVELAELNLARGRAEQARDHVLRVLNMTPVTAEALWLGVRTERALGNAKVADVYAKRLKTEHPAAEQTRALIASERKP
jgi:type IV pilus assembly protein PilF